MTSNLEEEGQVTDATPSIAPQSIPLIMEPSPWTFPIPEYEEASAKDSMISRLPTKERDMGGEASGSGGQPTPSTMGQSKVYMPVGGGTEDEEKMAPVAKETKQKGELTMDPMVESSLRSKEDLALAEETIPLVGKWWRCQGPPQGVSCPILLGLVRWS